MMYDLAKVRDRRSLTGKRASGAQITISVPRGGGGGIEPSQIITVYSARKVILFVKIKKKDRLESLKIVSLKNKS